MANQKFQNALKLQAQKTPPIWMMRQAGRYHKHYQALRAEHEFMELCKNPKLAAEVALGPIEDFDFDVSILFSDLLFPLEALGLKLEYSPGPKFDRELTPVDLPKLNSHELCLEQLAFQGEAAQLTRKALPEDKSLIGFVGGPWTLFSYGVVGGHDGNLIKAKIQKHFFNQFCERLVPLLIDNIQLQLDGGCELIMIFDTAAGELSPSDFNNWVVPQLSQLAKAHPGKLAYYSKHTHQAHLNSIMNDQNWAGMGFDHRWKMSDLLPHRKNGFTQGNFDQALLFSKPKDFEESLLDYLEPIKALSDEERAGWVCGLGHGVLPKTPEENVRRFVQLVRKELS